MRMTVENRNNGYRSVGREQSCEYVWAAWTDPLARLERAEYEVRGGQTYDVATETERLELVRGP
jgi:hypothetical protein